MNKVVHFEIPADDLSKIRDFYGTVFGWEFKPLGEEYITAIATKTDINDHSVEVGAINGGIQKRSMRAMHPTFVIQVDSIDEKLEEVTSKGGKVAVPKEQLGESGFYAQFEDPENNRIGLFQPKK